MSEALKPSHQLLRAQQWHHAHHAQAEYLELFIIPLFLHPHIQFSSASLRIGCIHSLSGYQLSLPPQVSKDSKAPTYMLLAHHPVIHKTNYIVILKWFRSYYFLSLILHFQNEENQFHCLVYSYFRLALYYVVRFLLLVNISSFNVAPSFLRSQLRLPTFVLLVNSHCPSQSILDFRFLPGVYFAPNS